MTIAMRLVVGATFVFSGFAKAIDPWGTQYKITEYLLTLGWDSWAGLSLLFALALSAVEMMLGVAVMVGAYRRSAPAAMIAVLAVMTPLTLWLAVTDAVPDCGCFGDALTLSNWATFGKNLLLLAGAVYLLVVGRRVGGLFTPAVQWMVLAATLAYVAYVGLEGYFVQPLLDFRPYPAGTQLVSDAPSTSDADYVFVYERDGNRQEFSIDDVPDPDSGWTFVARRELPSQPAPLSANQRTIALADDAGIITAELLENDSDMILLLFPDLPEVSAAHTYMLNELTDFAHNHATRVVGITSAIDSQIAQWADLSMAAYPMLIGDDSEIKMIARGNPAVVFLHGNTIQWKRTLGSITNERLHTDGVTPASLSDDFRPARQLQHATLAYLLALVAVLLLNRSFTGIRTLVGRHNRKHQSNNTNQKNLDK